MPSNMSPATDASAIPIWVFSVQKAEMVEREKELMTVEVAMVSCRLEVNFSFSIFFFDKKRILPYVYGHKGHSLIKRDFAVRKLS